MTKRGPGLIITADDFGLHESVNQAVERAHREGVLSAASLMVAAPAAADAIARARAFPSLRVGLHLVLADGQSILPHAAIPDLVDAKGRFGDRMARDGVRFFFLPWVRRQLAAEIRAQFEAFAASWAAAGSRQHPQTFSSASHAAAADYRHRPTVRLAGDTLAQRKAHPAPAQTLACAIATQTIEGWHRAQRPYGRHRVLGEIR